MHRSHRILSTSTIPKPSLATIKFAAASSRFPLRRPAQTISAHGPSRTAAAPALRGDCRNGPRSLTFAERLSLKRAGPHANPYLAHAHIHRSPSLPPSLSPPPPLSLSLSFSLASGNCDVRRQQVVSVMRSERLQRRATARGPQRRARHDPSPRSEPLHRADVWCSGAAAHRR